MAETIREWEPFDSLGTAMMSGFGYPGYKAFGHVLLSEEHYNEAREAINQLAALTAERDALRAELESLKGERSA